MLPDMLHERFRDSNVIERESCQFHECGYVLQGHREVLFNVRFRRLILGFDHKDHGLDKSLAIYDE